MSEPCIFLETIQELEFHKRSSINSTFSSAICDKSSASYTRMLAENSMSDKEIQVRLIYMSGFAYAGTNKKNHWYPHFSLSKSIL